MKSVHFHTFVYSLVFRFKFFYGISLEIRARSDAGPGLFYSALPKMGKAKVYDYQVFPLNGGKLIIVYYTSVFAENTSLL